MVFLSTLSLRRATHYDNYNLHCVEISIHALLAESDGIGLVFLWWGVRISIHALLAESDGGCSPGRATAGISIHALLAESDKLEKYGIKMQGLFLSTLSLRRATLELFLYYQDNTISIHALLAESDAGRSVVHRSQPDFYPRSPCGERPNKMGTNMQDIQFLSTLSLRRATIPFVQFLLHTPISIHALLAESDAGRSVVHRSQPDFYPRSPCGERQVAAAAGKGRTQISIHALLAESDDH